VDAWRLANELAIDHSLLLESENLADGVILCRALASCSFATTVSMQ
jgi:hypothetical protein